jgi:hypothetical protein
MELLQDKDAETVLLILGEHLIWTPWEEGMIGDMPGTTRNYPLVASFVDDAKPFIWRLNSSVMPSREWDTLSAAKAACEFHNATGRWNA